MRTTRTFFRLLTASLLLSGCSLFDPEEPIPAYLVIPEFDMETNHPIEGTDSHRITEVWVYVDARMIGAFAPPVEVPILKEGITEIQLFAGVQNNNLPSARRIYPFIEDVQFSIDASPLKKDTIRPTFNYRSNANIVLVDDFEAANTFALDPSAQGSMERITDPELVFEGTRSLHVTLNESEVITRIITNEQQFELPSNRLIYLELNYRTDNTVAVGLVANGPFGTSREYVTILQPPRLAGEAPEWQKIYIDMQALTAMFAGSTFEVVFECRKDGNNTTANFWLDNIKIVHF